MQGHFASSCRALSRVPESLPPSAALRVQVFVLQTWLRRLRVTAAALPLASCNPLLVEEKPLDGPWDDPIHDVFTGPPLVFDRIMDTQARERGGMTEAKDVLRGFARPARIGADRWIDDEHADVRILQKPAIE